MVSKLSFVIAYLLRITHIALWLTIPTTFLRWLDLAETPAECVPEYERYGGNALCVSEDSFFFIVFGSMLLGFCVIALWIMGFILEGICRVAHGDRKLPPVQWSVILTGWGLLWHSLRYWFPFIAAALAAHEIRSSLYPRYFGSPALDLLLLALALVLFCGYLAGIVRFTASGDLSRIWRRLENIDVALSNAKHSLLLVFSLFLVSTVGIHMWTKLVQHVQLSEGTVLLVEAAVSSFAFYFLLLCWSITCSLLIGLYARKIGIGDNLKTEAKLE